MKICSHWPFRWRSEAIPVLEDLVVELNRPKPCLNHHFGQLLYLTEPPACKACGRPWQGSYDDYIRIVTSAYFEDPHATNLRTTLTQTTATTANEPPWVFTQREGPETGGELPGGVPSRPVPPSPEVGSALRLPDRESLVGRHNKASDRVID